MWRFLTGIGLGGGIPTALTMVGDYAPESRRGMLVMIVSLANAAGSSIGAFASGEIIPIYGWRSVFIAGGVLPMILAVILLLALSESPRWLALRDGSSAKLRRILKRMAPQHNPPENVRYTVVDDEVKGIPVTKLFTDGRAMSTVLLWIIFFMGFLNLFSLSNWLPTMMASAGASTREAVASTALFQIGGFVGGLLLSGFIQKRGERGLAASYLCMAASIVVTGYFSSEFYVAMIAVFFSGFFLIASVTGVNGYTAAFYPVSIRATGMGWGLGMGRFGSIVGPLAAAYLISLHWSNRDVFMACAIPALIACIGLLCIRRKPVLLPAAARESLAG
jgi:AAHS family 4-hydroxybenzoate transporter-like MFS transporter